ncbi:oxidoreductase [Superficieibacter electus]|uniref:Oxidoreductase n=1 Tax=Superficieibacter electus TaxID=2022662 RepID=A0A2P5GKT3_9ENTR|nr:iron-containing alcohol dehydrogenase family protein [Superficieibacter electus]POP44070.1 oxidoreductase [Superficieibacter electus]POP45399.1 oxidoreductase [Superficieibacter electus]
MLAIKSPDTYYHEPGLRHEAGKIIATLSQNILLIASPRAWAQIGPDLEVSLRQHNVRWRVEMMNGECSDTVIAHFIDRAKLAGAGLILGVGGGRVLDTAKAVANGLEQVMSVTFPTIAATCAAWSPLTIIYDDAGRYQRRLLLDRLPKAVLVDSEIIAKSSVRYLKAGIVDALAKWYEFAPYQRLEPASLALNLKVQTARQALDTFRQYGTQALLDNEQGLVSEALIRVIDASIAIAGMANSIREDNPTPGVAHAIHNRLTWEPELHHWLHGEKVGFCLLVQSLLERGDIGPDPELLAFLRQYEMPLTLAPLSAPDPTVFRAIAEGVTIPDSAAKRLPFDVSTAALEQALHASSVQF